ncbi:MAG: hypothetical protein H6728_12825 [Myxococcales bacterium]|nr:hypothetical protein [Myxococcales bacterium]MCB9643952.1 hypothetical protein [Myxococcales bacterium]
MQKEPLWRRRPRIFGKRLALWCLWGFVLLGQGACFLGEFSMVGFPCAETAEGKPRCGTNERCAEGICTPIDAPGPPCQKAADCRTRLCNADGFCTSCSAAKDCASGFCEQGVCKPCDSDSQCPGFCDKQDQTCKPCSQDQQCPGFCDSNTGLCKPCEQSADCKDTLFCKRTEGRCAPCERDGDCPGFCDPSGRCVPCTKADDCITTFFCDSSGSCAKCVRGTDCSSGVCDNNGVCQKSCANDAQCSSGLCKNGRCESCEKAEDCASYRCSDGRCLGPCKGDNECPNGRLCKSGRCELPQENDPCSPISGSGCQGALVCVSIEGQNRCRRACDPLQTSPCPSGQGCSFLQNIGSEVIGVCLDTRPQGKQVGEPCDAANNQCAVELICRSDGLQSLCRKVCDPNVQGLCAQGEECIEVDQPRSRVGLCLPPTCENIPGKCTNGTYCYQRECRKTCDPAQPTGAPCLSTQFCEAVSGGGSVKGVCSERTCGIQGKICSLSQVCKNTFSCQSIASPKNCTTDSECGSGAICVDWPDRGYKGCYPACKIPNSKVECAPDYLCVAFPVTSAESPRSACMPSRGGGLEGAACGTINTSCERSHTCVAFGDDALCLATCEPRRAAGQQGCPSSYRCLELQSSTLGVCIRDTVQQTNEECGPLVGFCDSTNVCVSEAGQSKSYCRKSCTSSADCSNGEQCFSIGGGTRNVCLQP